MTVDGSGDHLIAPQGLAGYMPEKPDFVVPQEYWGDISSSGQSFDEESGDTAGSTTSGDESDSS